MARKEQFDEDTEPVVKKSQRQKKTKKSTSYQEEGQDWASWLKSLLGVREPSRFRNPLTWGDFNSELQMSSVQNEMFDGLNVEVMKPISGSRYLTAQAQHNLKIGSAAEAPSYSLMNVFQHTRYGWVVGRIDAEGGLMARLGTKTERFDSKVAVQLAKEAHQNIVSLEADFPVLDSVIGLKWQLPSMIALSYVQPVSDSVHLGVEGTYVGKQAITVFTLGGRYCTPLQEVSRGRKNPPSGSKKVQTRSITTAQLSQSGIQLAYVKQISQMFTLSSEFQIGMTQNGLDSTFITGADIRVSDQVRSRIQADSSLTVRSILEEGYTDFTKLTLCSELDHKKQAYKIGVGFQLQI